MKLKIKAGARPTEAKTLENYLPTHKKLKRGRNLDKISHHSDDVTAGRWDVPDYRLDPPEVEDPYEDKFDEEVYVDVSDVIVVPEDKNAMWDFETDDCKWAYDDEESYASYNVDGLDVTDPDLVIEDVYNLLDAYVPDIPGRYKVDAEYVAKFKVDIEFTTKSPYQDEDGEWWADREYNRSDAQVRRISSELKNVEIKRID